MAYQMQSVVSSTQKKIFGSYIAIFENSYIGMTSIVLSPLSKNMYLYTANFEAFMTTMIWHRIKKLGFRTMIGIPFPKSILSGSLQNKAS